MTTTRWQVRIDQTEPATRFEVISPREVVFTTSHDRVAALNVANAMASVDHLLARAHQLRIRAPHLEAVPS